MTHCLKSAVPCFAAAFHASMTHCLKSAVPCFAAAFHASMTHCLKSAVPCFAAAFHASMTHCLKSAVPCFAAAGLQPRGLPATQQVGPFTGVLAAIAHFQDMQIRKACSWCRSLFGSFLFKVEFFGARCVLFDLLISCSNGRASRGALLIKFSWCSAIVARIRLGTKEKGIFRSWLVTYRCLFFIPMRRVLLI